MLNDLLAGAAKQAEQAEPAVRAAALMHVARVIARSDQAAAEQLLEQGIALAERIERDAPSLLLRNAVSLAAAVSAKHALPLYAKYGIPARDPYRASRNCGLGTECGLRVSATGIVVGTALVMVARQFFTQQVPDPRNSPWIPGGVAGLLLLLTVLACLVPVRRGFAVNPLTALRSEEIRWRGSRGQRIAVITAQEKPHHHWCAQETEQHVEMWWFAFPRQMCDEIGSKRQRCAD
jgi:hypothetical protein